MLLLLLLMCTAIIIIIIMQPGLSTYAWFLFVPQTIAPPTRAETSEALYYSIHVAYLLKYIVYTYIYIYIYDVRV